VVAKNIGYPLDVRLLAHVTSPARSFIARSQSRAGRSTDADPVPGISRGYSLCDATGSRVTKQITRSTQFTACTDLNEKASLELTRLACAPRENVAIDSSSDHGHDDATRVPNAKPRRHRGRRHAAAQHLENAIDDSQRLQPGQSTTLTSRRAGVCVTKRSVDPQQQQGQGQKSQKGAGGVQIFPLCRQRFPRLGKLGPVPSLLIGGKRKKPKDDLGFNAIDLSSYGRALDPASCRRGRYPPESRPSLCN
jgi:hypothetical protein